MPTRKEGDRNWRPGPEVERAYGFEIAFCEDPKCGLHVVPFRADGTQICEVVMSRDSTLNMVLACKDWLYAKVATQDGDENGGVQDPSGS